ncbi:MAG: hypothetical protein KKD01_15640 [Proteobacteria bacterium]|nr:hypothetical protein [Pseudomonadota bacterium]MBU1231648.1 hypothetical protein [Pseudomonadota bacterium]MBU1417658.1 hypothetical protein [Pseudomonadota bacterium]MBU1456157.1 hypothetical protein [Pseudomonadota bacterium]
MPHSLEKEIKIQLWNNQSKKNIYQTLATDSNKDELYHLLANLPCGGRRKKTFLVTLFLVFILTLLTIKQCLFIYFYGRFDVSAALTLVGPIIHIFIIRELLLSHRLGYQLLPILSILALFRPENQIVPDMYMYVCIAVLSALLYLLLFPKSEHMQSKTN